MAEPSQAFLLRCWQVTKGDGELAWRFILIDVYEKQEKKGFANLEAVFAYLQQTLASIDRDVSGEKR